MSPALVGALPDSSINPEENIVRASLDKMPKGLESFIKSLFSSGRVIGTLAMTNIMDLLFDGQPWGTFDYETVVESLTKAGLQLPSMIQMNQIQVIAALRNGQSFIDKEWNLFEKAVLAVNGIPVLFFEKQNIPIEYIYHAHGIMMTLFKLELSEEVKHYIGVETLNDEILWHPSPLVDSCVKFSLDTIGKSSLGLDMQEMSSLRDETAKRFGAIKELPIETIKFNETSPSDVMCSRILRSLAVGRDLMQAERHWISHVESLRSGKPTDEGISEEFKQVVSQTMSSPEKFDPDVELIPAGASDDYEESVTVIKEAMAHLVDGAFVYNKDAVVNSTIAKQAAVKQSSASIPIVTGTPMFGLEDTRQDPDRDLEKSMKIEGTASEIMRESANQAKVSKSEDDDESETAGDGFNIFNM